MLLIGPIGVAELSVSEEYFKQLSALFKSRFTYDHPVFAKHFFRIWYLNNQRWIPATTAPTTKAFQPYRHIMDQGKVLGDE